jgi:hypothetical protein
MAHLADALEQAYRMLGFEDAAGEDDVFRHLVLARIIESASKFDSLRVLEEAGIPAASYRTVRRRLPTYAGRLGSGCPRPAPRAPARACQPCPQHALLRNRRGGTGSASPGSPRSGAWSRRSPSAYSPGRTGSP